MEPTVFVVDDDAAVCRAITGVGKLLGNPIRSFASAAEFLDAYDPSQAGCLVLDIKMPGMTGLELQQELSSRNANLPIIMISGHADVRIAVEVMTRGAVTLLEKPFRLDELLSHIRAALEQNAAIRARAIRQAEKESRLAGLTPKEREVLEAVAAGKTNREIADVLGLSLRAVEDRRARLMKKVQCRSVAELIQMFSEPQI